MRPKLTKIRLYKMFGTPKSFLNPTFILNQIFFLYFFADQWIIWSLFQRLIRLEHFKTQSCLDQLGHKIFWHKICFWPKALFFFSKKIHLDPKWYFWTQIFFGHKIFLDVRFLIVKDFLQSFFIKNLFWPDFYWTQNCFGAEIFLMQKLKSV